MKKLKSIILIPLTMVMSCNVQKDNEQNEFYKLAAISEGEMYLYSVKIKSPFDSAVQIGVHGDSTIALDLIACLDGSEGSIPTQDTAVFYVELLPFESVKLYIETYHDYSSCDSIFFESGGIQYLAGNRDYPF